MTARRFSIRYKFLSATTVLLIVCVSTYFALTTDLFNEEKIKLVFELNSSAAGRVTSDIETLLERVADKIKVVSYFQRLPKSDDVLSGFFSDDADVVFVGKSYALKAIDQTLFVQKQFGEMHGLSPDFYQQQIPEKRPVPFARLQSDGQALWNATIKDGPPLLGYAKLVSEEDQHGVPINQYGLVVFVRADKLVKASKQSSLNNVFVVNRYNEVLAPVDSDVSMATHPLVQQAMAQSQIKTQVLKYQSANHDSILGVFTKGFNNEVIVVSEINEAKAFLAVTRVLYRTGLLSSIILTLAFIMAIFFSRSLTRPVELLVAGMDKVSQGDLSVQIDVRSRDEMDHLAKSFNRMILDLKASRFELESINRDLENKVRERTQQLEKQNLAIKEAQEAMIQSSRLAAMGELAGQTAHEVLNPLTSILSRMENVKKRYQGTNAEQMQLLAAIETGWSNDLKKGGLPQLQKNWDVPSKVHPQQNLLQEDLGNLHQLATYLKEEVQRTVQDTDFVLKEGQRINRILTNMKTFTVVDAVVKEHDVIQLVHEGIDIMRDLADKQRSQIIFSDKEPLFALIGHDEFLQCLTNLLRNSLHAIRDRKTPGSGEITVACQPKSGSIEILVTDNGSGIPAEVQAMLFTRTFTTKSREEGTGIGLQISRRLMRAFGGDVVLESSKANVGTTFKIILPESSEQKQSA